MRRVFFTTGFAQLLLLLSSFVWAAPESITLAVANSTCDAVKRVGELYSKESGVDITYICKSSGLLAKGIRGGAIEADIYVSANKSWMDYMVEGGVVEPGRITVPWGNTLVVATNKSSSLEIGKWDELAGDKVSKILIGDPGTAPFGRYAKEAFEATNLWDQVKGKIETKKNIALLVESLANEKPSTVGILFYSNMGNELREVYSLDPAWHSLIRYYLAPVKKAQMSPHVDELLKFIQGSSGQTIFREERFLIVAEP